MRCTSGDVAGNAAPQRWKQKNPAGIFPTGRNFKLLITPLAFAPSIRQWTMRVEWNLRIHSDQNILRCDQQA
jgi:hypothetical protein